MFAKVLIGIIGALFIYVLFVSVGFIPPMEQW